MAAETRSASGARAKGHETDSTTAKSDVAARPSDVDFMTSLARGLAVIRAFSERGRGLTIAQLSRSVGIPRAAVRRCLHTLEELGYVVAESRVFSLQPKILTL